MPTLDKTIAQLNQVLSTCHRGQVAFKYCEQNADAEELRSFFSNLVVELPLAGDHLRRQITRYGGRPVQHVGAAGMLYCVWQRLKLLLGQTDDQVLLKESSQALLSICRDFESLLQEELPPVFRDPLVVQYDALLKRQAQLQALLDAQRLAD